MNMTIHFIVSAMNMSLFYSNHVTCVDYFGVRASPYLLIEWCSTVPFMFFLILCLDVKKVKMSRSDIAIQALAAAGLFSLFLCFERLPAWLIYTLFISANVFVACALGWLLHDAYEEYSAALKMMNKLPREEWESFQYKDLHDELVVSQWKMNCALFIGVSFNIFPLLYYLYMVRAIGFVYFTYAIHAASVATKVVVYNILCDGYMEIIDVNKILLLEEKKRSAASKRTLLRYVFHEVRVPLNSITLGTDLLLQNDSLTEEEVETLFMMKDASMFMTNTLNDVLSLQKIEDGKLQLEEKLFAPESIIKSMLSNLR